MKHILTKILNHSPEKVPFATLQVLIGVMTSGYNYYTTSLNVHRI